MIWLWWHVYWVVLTLIFADNQVGALKEYQMRDFEDNRLMYLERVDELFHAQMATYDAIFRAHWGREDGMDPASLCQVKHILGVKGLTANMPEFNMCRRFVRTCGEGFALAAISSELGAETWGDVQKKLSSCENYVDLLHAVVKSFYTLK